MTKKETLDLLMYIREENYKRYRPAIRIGDVDTVDKIGKIHVTLDKLIRKVINSKKHIYNIR